jgi:nucleoside 2-deoxyribosyltransferase
LRNPEIPVIAARLRSEGHEVFDDWHSAGPHADDIWRDYEKARGRSLVEALAAPHAEAVFNLDRDNLLSRDTAVLVLPAGMSAAMELGFAAGKGKSTHVLMQTDVERWDIMLKFAGHVHADIESLIRSLA